ncbi:MAG: Crp/Fnr family transcriptional regulator [Gemmatimonadaceae bacterium]
MPATPKSRRSPRTPRVPQSRNSLLAALPAGAYAEIAPHLTLASLASGEVLYEPFDRVTKVYFPESALLSIITRMSDGSAIEVGTVGSEGFVGLCVLFGVLANPTLCVAQIPGTVHVLPADVLRTVLEHERPVRDVLLRYAQTYVHQVGQRLACSVVHTVPQRCARWLLAADDTAGGQSGMVPPLGFLLTQEYLAYMLGVRREGVSAAQRVLRSAGLIRFSRGRITVTNRIGLEAASCECYATVAAEYSRVLGGAPGPKSVSEHRRAVSC